MAQIKNLDTDTALTYLAAGVAERVREEVKTIIMPKLQKHFDDIIEQELRRITIDSVRTLVNEMEATHRFDVMVTVQQKDAL